MTKPRDPVAILHEQRPVGAHLVIEHIDGALVGEWAEHGAADIARQHLRAGEHHDAQQPERDAATAPMRFSRKPIMRARRHAGFTASGRAHRPGARRSFDTGGL